MRYTQTAACGATGSVALAISLSFGTPAAAQEFCVACTGPDALYRCVLESAAPTGIPLKFLCIKTLAREGGHATCSVRGGTVFDCDAPIRRVDPTLAAKTLSAAPFAETKDDVRSPGSGPAGGPNPDPVRKGDASPDNHRTPKPIKPDTIEGYAKDLSRSSKETLIKTGEGIKNTTTKAWDCIASLFKAC